MTGMDLELRDWFAGQALAAILSSAPHTIGGDQSIAKERAEQAYRFADAMMEARKREITGDSMNIV